MFLHFLRWLKANTDLDFEILLLAGGPLTSEFEAVAPVRLVEALGQGPRSYLEAGLARAGLANLGDRLKVSRSRRAVADLCGFDALYLNSTTSALALRILPEIPPLVLSHIHELDAAFRYWFPESQRSAMLDQTDRFVACAESVAVNLIGGWRVPSSKVSCHHEFILPPQPTPGGAARARAELGIPATASIVGGAGSVIWRKGPDLFIQMANDICRNRPDLDLHFVWVGAPSLERTPVEFDLAKMGLADRVHFVGEVDRPDDLFSAFDVFALTSREDPFPLVMLETAAIGVPIVSFANGGVSELAGSALPSERRAIVVDYLDVAALGEAVVDLCENEGERLALGRRGQRRVLEHHVVDVGAADLYRELRSALDGGPVVRPVATPTRRVHPVAPPTPDHLVTDLTSAQTVPSPTDPATALRREDLEPGRRPYK